MANSREAAEKLAKSRLREKSLVAKRLLNSEDGKQLMKILEEEFNSDMILVPGDSHATHYKLGRRDVVIYLQQLLRYENDNQ